mmetsp:Transcript_22278/g.52446  ORF Transcript_22278/g.52446 Transcript_22278/m.52446 type:complete len:205 (-) Transcript_22278:619-1233(-)
MLCHLRKEEKRRSVLMENLPRRRRRRHLWQPPGRKRLLHLLNHLPAPLMLNTLTNQMDMSICLGNRALLHRPSPPAFQTVPLRVRRHHRILRLPLLPNQQRALMEVEMLTVARATLRPDVSEGITRPTLMYAARRTLSRTSCLSSLRMPHRKSVPGQREDGHSSYIATKTSVRSSYQCTLATMSCVHSFANCPIGHSTSFQTLA